MSESCSGLAHFAGLRYLSTVSLCQKLRHYLTKTVVCSMVSTSDVSFSLELPMTRIQPLSVSIDARSTTFKFESQNKENLKTKSLTLKSQKLLLLCPRLLATGNSNWPFLYTPFVIGVAKQHWQAHKLMQHLLSKVATCRAAPNSKDRCGMTSQTYALQR